MSGKMTLYKLVVLGDGGVGKTALTIQLCLNHFVETYDPTIEDSYRKQVVIDQQSCMLEVLDTAGQEEYTALRDQWIRDGEGFVLVYSITSRASFSRITKFYNQIKMVKESSSSGSPSGPSYLNSPMASGSPLPVPVMLVGNKSDKAVERAVSAQEGQALAKELGCEFTEASAKNCINVEKAFYDVVRMLRQQRQALQGRGQDRRQPGFGSSHRDRDSGPEYPKSFRPDRSRHRSRQCIVL
ncbi:Small GTPase superfamily Rho type [Penicillium taxi]|uniref:Small GTPase superfamily Rho type n=1 Tax=Penicillium taxi TaxID=168475 RepID=UPI002544DFC5|nr:Small GTPase superfamily Rho type [Penicillium taxi]KAJ5888785.1 Small GTPase superfamily Rho type [Penicillium taxi]